MIYPPPSEKQITLENCYFLVKLAHEYQMDAIVKKCEDFLVDELKTKPKDGILSDLVFAQTYKLEKLRQASVDRAQNFYAHYLEELRQDEMYDQIQSENLKEIMEGIIRQLQGESEESQRINDENKNKSDAVKLKIESALQDIEMIVNILFEHAVPKKQTVSNFEFCRSRAEIDSDSVSYKLTPCVYPSCKVFNVLAFKMVKNRFFDNGHCVRFHSPDFFSLVLF